MKKREAETTHFDVWLDGDVNYYDCARDLQPGPQVILKARPFHKQLEEWFEKAVKVMKVKKDVIPKIRIQVVIIHRLLNQGLYNWKSRELTLSDNFITAEHVVHELVHAIRHAVCPECVLTHDFEEAIALYFTPKILAA